MNLFEPSDLTFNRFRAQLYCSNNLVADVRLTLRTDLKSVIRKLDQQTLTRKSKRRLSRTLLTHERSATLALQEK